MQTLRYFSLAFMISTSPLTLAQSDSQSGLSSRLDVLTQIEELRTEVQSLRGQVEVMQHQQMQLEQQVRNFYDDLNRRIQTQDAPTSVAPVTISSTPAVSAKQPTYTGSPAIPTALATTPPDAVIAVDAAEATAVIKNAKSDLDAYQAAYLFLQNKQYNEAIVAFNTYLETYPKGEYIANVHYWLGEVYLAQLNYPQAEKAFSQVVHHYPQHQKAADALLKLGYAYEAAGDKKKALSTYAEVQQKYPNTAVAQLAQTKASQLKQKP